MIDWAKRHEFIFKGFCYCSPSREHVGYCDSTYDTIYLSIPQLLVMSYKKKKSVTLITSHHSQLVEISLWSLCFCDITELLCRTMS